MFKMIALATLTFSSAVVMATEPVTRHAVCKQLQSYRMHGGQGGSTQQDEGLVASTLRQNGMPADSVRSFTNGFRSKINEQCSSMKSGAEINETLEEQFLSSCRVLPVNHISRTACDKARVEIFTYMLGVEAGAQDIIRAHRELPDRDCAPGVNASSLPSERTSPAPRPSSLDSRSSQQ